MTRNERQGSAGKCQRLGEEAENSFVRAAAFRRVGDAHLPDVAVPADDVGPPRPGADAQAQPRRLRSHALSLRRAASPYAASAAPYQLRSGSVAEAVAGSVSSSSASPDGSGASSAESASISCARRRRDS